MIEITESGQTYLRELLAKQNCEGIAIRVFVLDGGTPKTSKTNVLDNVIPGLRVTLKGVTSAPASIGVGEPALDRDAIKDKVKAFVNAYNAVVDATRSELTEKPIADSLESAKLTVRLAAEARRQVVVAQNYRYSPAMAHLRRVLGWVDSGREDELHPVDSAGAHRRNDHLGR